MLKRPSQIWSYLSSLGTRGLPPDLAKRITLSNQLGVSLALVALFFTIPWALKGNLLMVTLNVVMGFMHGIVPLLSYRGHYNLSRFANIFWLSSVIFVFVGMLGKVGDIHMAFFPMSGLAVVIFGPKERWRFLLALMFPVVLFAILVFNDFQLFPNLVGETPWGLSGLNYFMTFLMVFFTMMYLYRATEKTESEYKELYEKHIESQRLLDEERSRAMYSTKMASLGEMAGGIAHEINSPLNVITILSEQMLKRSKSGQLNREMLEESLEKINSTGNRIGEIVSSLRSFSRTGQNLPKKTIDVKSLIEETLVLCREKFRAANIQLIVNIPEHLLLVVGRKTEISQVLINLLNNAFDAVQGVATPIIKLEVLGLPDRVRIAVVDNGPGIPSEIREKVFNPFFTTKEVGQGTGLGLSISKGLIENNQGSLYLDISEGKTKFVLELKSSNEGES